LWQDLQDLLGCHVDLVITDAHPRRERFMRNVMRDAVPL
jgi:predicted nucleotidyltransferase